MPPRQQRKTASKFGSSSEQRELAQAKATHQAATEQIVPKVRRSRKAAVDIPISKLVSLHNDVTRPRADIKLPQNLSVVDEKRREEYHKLNMAKFQSDTMRHKPMTETAFVMAKLDYNSDDDSDWTQTDDESDDKAQTTDRAQLNGTHVTRINKLFPTLRDALTSVCKDKKCDCFSKFVPEAIIAYASSFQPTGRFGEQLRRRQRIKDLLVSVARFPGQLECDFDSDDALRKRKSRSDKANVDSTDAQQAVTSTDSTPPRNPLYLCCSYMIWRRSVCMEFFQTVTSCGTDLLKKIKCQLHNLDFDCDVDGRGQYERETMQHTSGSDDFVSWLENFAEQEFAQHDPSAKYAPTVETLAANPDTSVVKPTCWLKATFTRKDVYCHYVAAMAAKKATIVSLRSCLRAWKTKAKHIRISSRYTDFCDDCVELRANDDRQGLLNHLELSKSQQTFIDEQVVQKARLSANAADPANREACHSMDMAQAKRIPTHLHQPSSEYYDSGRKVDIVGVFDEVRLQQRNILCAEGLHPGAKGIEITGNALINTFTTNPNTKASKAINIITDNCSAQNKCCYTVWLLLWLVIAGKKFFGLNVEKVEQHFNIVGHTKFAPDRNFGSIALACAKTAIYTPQHLFNVIDDSSCVNEAVCCTDVLFIDWKTYLGQFFDGKIEGILSQHHFRSSQSNPGVIDFKTYHFSEWSSDNLFKDGIIEDHILNPDKYPEFGFKSLEQCVLPNEQLSEKRAKEFNEICGKYKGSFTKEEYMGPCKPT